MPDRLKKLRHRHGHGWTPPPPDHTQPWGGWATHEMMDLRAQLVDLQDHIQDVTDELDRRALLIAAEREQRERLYSVALRSILSSPVLPYCAALGLLMFLMWWGGDRQGAIDTAKQLLLK